MKVWKGIYTHVDLVDCQYMIGCSYVSSNFACTLWSGCWMQYSNALPGVTSTENTTAPLLQQSAQEVTSHFRDIQRGRRPQCAADEHWAMNSLQHMYICTLRMHLPFMRLSYLVHSYLPKMHYIHLLVNACVALFLERGHTLGNDMSTRLEQTFEWI